jgi:uncharacterized membrane protein
LINFSFSFWYLKPHSWKKRLLGPNFTHIIHSLIVCLFLFLIGCYPDWHIYFQYLIFNAIHLLLLSSQELGFLNLIYFFIIYHFNFSQINFWDSTYVLVSIILIVYQHTRIYSPHSLIEVTFNEYKILLIVIHSFNNKIVNRTCELHFKMESSQRRATFYCEFQ